MMTTLSSAHPYGQAFPLLREATSHWDSYTRHAFVEGLRDGSLSEAAFIHYLKQDYVFLIHFSRAWALGVAKADNLEEMQACAGTVNALVNGEMQLHVKICEAAGITKSALEDTIETDGNLAYTRYVLEAGYSGDFLSLITTLAPCVMGYGEIGKRLASEKTSDTYAEWINTYAGDDYQEVCRDVGILLDQALTRRLGSDFDQVPHWKKLCYQFDMATRLEVGFWDMGLKPS